MRPTRRRLERCLLAIATAGSLLASSRAMPYDATWGNTWSDGSGVLSSRVMALAEFYDCTGVADSQKSQSAETGYMFEADFGESLPVPADNVMYRSQAECTAACKAGSCVLQSVKGVLSAPEHVVLHPNSSYAREAHFLKSLHSELIYYIC